ncbi:MAG: BNR-4 repeat-containing protein [Akkermansiaceae bacterium]
MDVEKYSAKVAYRSISQIFLALQSGHINVGLHMLGSHFSVILLLLLGVTPLCAQNSRNTKIDGYRGIWFELGQKSEFGDKYSGGLGTYTAKHVPLAIYRPEIDKTFFVYGGAPKAGKRQLLIMASEFDHKTGLVPKPTVVLDKSEELGKIVDDPHDNPSLSIDSDGYLWIFVSGRATVRQDWTFKSRKPYSTEAFDLVEKPSGIKRSYPQILHLPGSGFMHLFTVYEKGRRKLFFRTSQNGIEWAEEKRLANMDGHYQTSAVSGNRIATMFNHHEGKVNERTDIYYLETSDFGKTWTLADGTPIELPVNSTESPSKVFNGVEADKLVYLNDLNFDTSGNPILFYTTASNRSGKAHEPGPFAEPRRWVTSHWNGQKWNTREMPPSATELSTVSHNYDTGCLLVDGNTWRVIGPTGAPLASSDNNPKRFWGQGGEIETWESIDQGIRWKKTKQTTKNSESNHGYVRRVWGGKNPFAVFWSDGNPEEIGPSHLYFGSSDGSKVWKLPYHMTKDVVKPVEVGQ